MCVRAHMCVSVCGCVCVRTLKYARMISFTKVSPSKFGGGGVERAREGKREGRTKNNLAKSGVHIHMHSCTHARI